MNARPASFQSLTERQRECLELVAKGYTSKQIARSLSLSPSTVDNHIRAVIDRWNCSSRAEAARMFERLVAAQEDRPAVSIATTGNSGREQSLAAAALSLPPVGGRPNNLPLARRYYHIIQVALVALAAFSMIVITIAGIVHLVTG